MTIHARASRFNCCALLSDVTPRAFDPGSLPAQDYNSAAHYVAALTGSGPNTAIIDMRLIHDQRRDIPAIPRRGALPALWPEIIAWQAQGYGCFVNINVMDGSGRYEIANVSGIRCQAIDLDNLSAQQNYERAARAILQWLLDGHRAWIDVGKKLSTSGAIAQTTSAYFASQSTFEMWLTECAQTIAIDERDGTKLPKASEIYNSYAIWKRERGEQPQSQTKFGTWLAMQPGIEKLKSNGIPYRGVELIPTQSRMVAPGTTPPMPHTRIMH